MEFKDNKCLCTAIQDKISICFFIFNHALQTVFLNVTSSRNFKILKLSQNNLEFFLF